MLQLCLHALLPAWPVQHGLSDQLHLLLVVHIIPSLLVVLSMLTLLQVQDSHSATQAHGDLLDRPSHLLSLLHKP